MFDYSIANKMIKFCESLKIPSGRLVGQNFKLIDWQKEWFREVFKTREGKRVVKMGICSIGRKNAKTTTNALTLICMMTIKGLARANSEIYSGASSRDQASLIYELMKKIIQFSPLLQSKLKIVDSKKMIINLHNGVTFQALAADAGNALGKSAYVYLHDETAASKEDSEFIEAMQSSQGAYDDALTIHISTIGSSNQYYFNQLVDQYKDNKDESVYVVYYHVPEGTKGLFDDPLVWALANPSLNHFLSESNMRAYANQAKTLSSKKAHFMNYFLNMRIDSDKSFIQASDWQVLAEDWKYEDFYGLPAVAALDLSMGRYDLTSLTVVVKNGENDYKALQYTFSAKDSLEDNATRLKIPLQALAADENNHLILTPGITHDWEVLTSWIIKILSNFDVLTLGCDPYKINEVQRYMDEQNYSINLEKINQGFLTFTKCVSALENLIFNKHIHHNNNFFLGYGLSNCQVVEDAHKNVKLMKKSANNKIDPAISTAMCAYLVETELQSYDENSLSFAII